MRERLVRVREHEAAMATMCGSATPVAEAAAALLRGLDHNLAENESRALTPARAVLLAPANLKFACLRSATNASTTRRGVAL